MLAQSCLFYFKDPGSTEPIGFFQMENVRLHATYGAYRGKQAKLEIRPARDGGKIKSVKYVQ